MYVAHFARVVNYINLVQINLKPDLDKKNSFGNGLHRRRLRFLFRFCLGHGKTAGWPLRSLPLGTRADWGPNEYFTCKPDAVIVTVRQRSKFYPKMHDLTWTYLNNFELADASDDTAMTAMICFHVNTMSVLLHIVTKLLQNVTHMLQVIRPSLVHFPWQAAHEELHSPLTASQHRTGE